MKFNTRKGLSVALLMTSLLSLPALAWGPTGHRITGAIAEQYLNPQAKSQINELLPLESLAEAATYADEMRSNPSEFWQKTATPWHWVTVPKGKTYDEVGAPPEGDGVSALAHFSQVLKDTSASKKERQLALRFIIHIIGDLHQPLHAGNGTDRGGNQVKVNFFWQDSNLHRVWDSEMLNTRELSYSEWTEWLTRKITAQNITDWSSTDPVVWITESTQIRDTIYPEDPEHMSWDYVYDYLPVAKQRLQQGGIRIAVYLNQLFADISKAKNK
jgi:hypothetical protein